MTVVPQAAGGFQIGKVINDTFAVTGRNVGLWVVLALIFSAVPAIILQLAIVAPLTGSLTTAGPLTDPNMIAATSWTAGLAGLISFLLALLLQSALIRGTIEDLSGKRPSLGDCISTAISVLVPVLGFAILAALAIFAVAVVGGLIAFGLLALAGSAGMGLAVVGGIFVLVPIIMLFLRWAVAVPAIVQERQGVLGSMRRSAALTKGSRWALFGLFVVLVIILAVIQFVVGMVVAMFGGVLALILALLVQSILSTIFSTAVAVTYVSLREAKEGTSVQELARIFA